LNLAKNLKARTNHIKESLSAHWPICFGCVRGDAVNAENL